MSARRRDPRTPRQNLAAAVERIGDTCWLATEEGYIEGRVRNVKCAYGRTDYLFAPILDGPVKWISGHRLTFDIPQREE